MSKNIKQAENQIEDLLSQWSEWTPRDYRAALEEMQSRAESALDALNEDEERNDDEGDE